MPAAIYRTAYKKFLKSDDSIGRTDWGDYGDRPEAFAREALGLQKLTAEQIAILNSLIQNRETNVQAAHGVGKTFNAAVAVLFWVFAIQGLAITTAPTFSQVRDLLWREIRQLYDANRDRLGGSRLELSVRLNESARAYGFATRNYDSNSFQGRHAERLLLIQDEACGISQTIDEAFESCLTGDWNRALRIGNPILPGTPFEKACKRSHLRIPVWGHPNVAWAYGDDRRLKPEVAAAIAPEGVLLPRDLWPDEFPRDAIPGAVSVAWIEDIRVKHGEGSPYWQSRVEGQFPADATASLVPRSWFQAARDRYDALLADGKITDDGRWTYGLDVGDGGDPHAMAGVCGNVLRWVDERQTKGDRFDTIRAARWGLSVLRDRPGALLIDQIGVGAGTVATILESINEDYALPQGERVYGDSSAKGCNWGLSPRLKRDRAVYANLKAHQCWMLREAFQKGLIAIAPLDGQEDRLQEELAAIYWGETATGKIQMEPKARTRDRLGRSPNNADAVILAWAGQWQGGGISLGALGGPSAPSTT